ncbi:unnamed protein product [Prunus armeniaca]
MANANLSNGNNLASLIPRFNSDNYDYWSNNVEVLLKAMELWNMVEDNYEEPENEHTLTQSTKKCIEGKLKEG